MVKIHKGGRRSVLNGLKPTLEGESPNWPEAERQTKLIEEMADALARNSAPNGDDDSWAKLTRDYQKNARALREAGKSKKPDAARDAHGKLTKSCTPCHDAHR